MANINFTDFETKKESRNFGDRVKIGYFNSLKEDGDETLIRLNYSTKADFKVTTVHRLLVDNKWRNIACLRGPYDTNDKCPLCASGDKMKSKIFVELLEYSKDENGNIKAEPKVWERGTGFVPELLEEMADAIEDEKITPGTLIRDVVLRVKRVGAKGSLDTKYKIKVMQPAVVPENVFTKDFSAFEGFDAAHHSYQNKTAEEMAYFLETKTFPTVEKLTTTTAASAATSTGAEVVHPGVAEDVTPFETAPASEEVKADTTTVKRYAW